MDLMDKKILRAKLDGFNGDLPLEEASTIPKLWYTDPLIYQAELESVFADSWLVACRSDEVVQPGSFITTVIAGEPIIVVRDAEDGQLRAFSNVCRHRAARVESRACGTETKMRCRYHGWTYNTKGQLVGVPEFGGVCNFNREEHPLPQWKLDTWGPYVFVKAPRANDGESLLDFLAPLPGYCKDLRLDKLKFHTRKEYVVNCNWKGYVDNYLDGCYHCNTMHPCLFSAIDYKNYRSVCQHNTVVQISPLKKAEDQEVGSVRKGREAYYSWTMPNKMINVYEGTMDTNRVLPLGPDKCLVIFDFFFEGDASAEKSLEVEHRALNVEKSIEVAHQVQMEDGDICEDVAGGLRSLYFDTGRFSHRREAGVYHFHQLLARRLRAFAAEEKNGEPETRVALPVCS